MSKVNLHKIISWIAVLIWMAFIFYLSHQPAKVSSELSSGVVQLVSGMLTALFPFMEFDIDQLHFFIRKGAHFFAYFTLGLLVLRAILIGRNIKVYLIGYAFIICVVYAISDEVHQLFIPGRSGELRDVLIDSVGSVTGIGFYICMRYARKHFVKGS